MSLGNRRRIAIYFALAIAGLAWSFWNPLHSRLTQLAFLGFGTAVLGLGPWLFPSAIRRSLFAGILAAMVVAGLILLLPGKQTDAEAFEKTLSESLAKQVGHAYHWGGEGFSGVDCSGLPRRAYREACWKRGLFEWNPMLWRAALENWWFDASAGAMKSKYRGQTTGTGIKAEAIVAIGSDQLRPGDMAVTSDGIHMLAYLGDNHWIQADPGEMKVIIEDAGDTQNHWMNTPVEIVRWSILAKH